MLPFFYNNKNVDVKKYSAFTAFLCRYCTFYAPSRGSKKVLDVIVFDLSAVILNNFSHKPATFHNVNKEADFKSMMT